MSGHFRQKRVEPAPSNSGKSSSEPEQKDLLTAIAEYTQDADRITGVVVGRISGFDSKGRPLVDFECNAYSRPLAAASVPEIDDSHIGLEAALMFEKGRSDRPVIMGLMHGRATSPGKEELPKTIHAETELLIKCGESSILLKKDGNIIISGKEILSRASRNNVIRGGTIHLN